MPHLFRDRRDVSFEALYRRHNVTGWCSLLVEKENSRMSIELEEIIIVGQQDAISFPTITVVGNVGDGIQFEGAAGTTSFRR